MSKIGKILHWIGHGLSIAIIVFFFFANRGYIKEVATLQAEIDTRDSSALAYQSIITDLEQSIQSSKVIQETIVQDLNNLNNEVQRQKGINRTLKKRTLTYERIIDPTTVDSILTKYSRSSPRNN